MSNRSLTGNIYGDIKVMEYIGDRKYKCQCIKCGALSEQYSANLKGEMQCQKCGKGFRVNLTGNHYGFLTVKEYNKQSKKWVCECKCGRKTEVKSNNLKHNNTMSCGKCKYEELAQRDIVGGTRVSQINKKINRNNTSGVAGVGYNKLKEKWYAAIRFRGKSYWLGYYDSKEDAVRTRRTAEQNLHKDFFAWLQEEFPEQWKKVKDKL